MPPLHALRFHIVGEINHIIAHFMSLKRSPKSILDNVIFKELAIDNMHL